MKDEVDYKLLGIGGLLIGAWAVITIYLFVWGV